MASKFDEHYAYTDELRRPLLTRVRRQLLDWNGNLKEKVTAGQRIAYSKTGGNVFLEVKIQRHAIVFHMVDVPDPDHLLELIPESHDWKQLARRAKVRTPEELERVLPLIRAAWWRG